MGLFDFMKKKEDFSDSSLPSDNNFGYQSQNGSNITNSDSSKADFSGFSSQGMYGNSSNSSNSQNGDDGSYNPPDPFNNNMNPSSSYSPIDRDAGMQHQNASNHPGHHSVSSKNMEIVLSKLDAIRLAIQNIDHRLSTIENNMESQKGNGHNLRSPDEDNLY